MSKPVVDVNGREVKVGDLIRTFHLKDGRRNRYLYHGVIFNEKEQHMEMVPIQTLCGLKPDGGRYWVTQSAFDSEQCEIIDGPIINRVDWYERPKTKRVNVDELMKYLHRHKYGLRPEQAQRAYDEAPEVPMTEDEINRIVDYVLNKEREDAQSLRDLQPVTFPE